MSKKPSRQKLKRDRSGKSIRRAAEEMIPESAPRRRRARPQSDSRVEIPSRDRIIEALRQHGVPMLPDELAASLGVISGAEREALSARFAAMERDGQLMTNR